MSELARSVLKRYWGYPTFRPLQEEIVDSVMAGCDTLALLPTGGGKSICFQVPAMAMDGICIVITPLIALMKDQVAHLVEKGIPAAAVYSGMHPDELELAYNQAAYGRLKFLYVSPERLQTNAFIEALKMMKVCLLAVDESHCISQWGYDFRPPYLKIAEIRPYFPKTPVLALTATATAKVVEDIQSRLGFKQPNVLRGSFERDNLAYVVVHEADKYGVLLRKLQAMKSGSAIVYVRNRKRTQVVSDWLNSVGVPATYYHAGLETKVRDQRQSLWMNGKVKVIVATNAFGMGIDKPDVRLVIHMDLSDSIEAYFQEAGRAGRDSQPAEAIMLVSDTDVRKLHENMQQSFPPLERIKLIYAALGNYYQIPVGAGENISYSMMLGDFASRYNFSVVEVFHTLKLLEKEGFLILSDSFDEPSKVMVKVSCDDLYGFQVNNPQFGTLVKYLLRGLPGLFTDFVRINEEAISQKTGLPVDTVVKQLKKLEEYHFLTYVQRNTQPRVLFLSEFVDSRHLNLSRENYYDRKKDAEERVKAVEAYVNNNEECRSAQLLLYFNEKTEHACGRCDVCRNQEHGGQGSQYEQIYEEVKNLLGENVMSIRDVMRYFTDYDEETVLEAIRYLVDEDVLQLGEGGSLKRKIKKAVN